MLRKRWQHLLLSKLKKKFANNRQIKALINEIYKKQDKGFYVHAKNRMRNAKGAAQYIGRYVSRPAIAESRIESYDGEKVQFWYERHDNGQKVKVEMPVFEFIGKLLRHIPDRYFKMVRYYGIYSRKRKHQAQLIMSVWQRFKKIIKQKLKWRESIKKSFGHDPLCCPKYGRVMELNDIVYKKYGSMLARIKRRMLDAYEKEEKELIEKLTAKVPGGSVSMYGMCS